jgi:protein SCO1/2
MMKFILAGILVVMVAAIGYVTYEWYEARYGGEPYGKPFALTDQNGSEITEAAFRDHPSVIFFGFTNCPEICPTTLSEMDVWLKELGDEGKDIHAYFVTIDPERDTVEVMKQYVTAVSDRITGITGDPAKVEQMASDFGIYFKKVEMDTGGYTMDHTASVLLLTPRGEFAGTIAYGEKKDTAIAKLKRIASEG